MLKTIVEDKVLNFKVYWQDTLSAEVSINYTNRRVQLKKYITDNIMAMPFIKDESQISVEDVDLFFSERCFPETRQNSNELLEDLGLSIYNPLAIVKKTRGLMIDDFMWIKFEGDEVTWNDIKIRD